MDFNNDKKQRGLGPSFLLERKQRISIEGRGDMYIKNTQTQVRELYRREALNEPRRSSSSNTDSQLLKTSLEVKALNKKIEREIGRLKNFRYSFLKDDQSPVQKQKPAPTKATVKHLHWRQKLLRHHKGRTFDESPTSSNRQDLQSIGFSSPDTGDRRPYFRTMCVASSPKSSASEQVDSSRPTTGDNRLDRKQNQPEQKITRMCGGCVYGHGEDMSRPCSVYQSDYCQYGGASFCPQCTPNSYRTCDMPGPVPMPYSPDPLYQYRVGSVNQQQDSMMTSCTCSRPSCCRRRTDLNTDKFCHSCADPLSNRDRSPKTKDNFLSRSPSPRPQTRRVGKEKGRSESPYKYPSQREQRPNPDKVMKISFRKQQSELSESAKTKPAKDKMIIKAYVAAQAPAIDRHQIDEEKLRMHREYMEMYRMEHEKTAGKDSSINMSELGISPTYTILPVQESTSAKHCRSYIVGTSTSRQVRFSLDQCKCEDPSEAKICQDTVTQTVVTNSRMQQMENSSSVEYESCEAKTDQFQKRTLSVKRNDVVKTVSSCQTDEVEEDFLDERSSYGASGMSQWQLAQQPPSMTNQSSQTSPKIAGPTVSSYMSQCQGIIRKQTTTQTDIQSDSRDWQECPDILTHEQLLSLNQENAVQRPTTRRDLATVSEQPTFSGTLEHSYRKVVQSEPVIQSPRAEFAYDNGPISAAERPEAFQSQPHVWIQNSSDATVSPRKCIPWHELTSSCTQSQQICRDSSGVQQNAVDFTEEIYEDCKCPGSTPVHTDYGNDNVDYRNQHNLPPNLTTTEYTSLVECPDYNSIKRPDDCEPFEDTTADYDSIVEELSNTMLSMQVRSPTPTLDATLTCRDQDEQDFNPCDDSQYIPQLEEPGASGRAYLYRQEQLIHNFEPPRQESYDREQLAIREQSSQNRSTVRERRARSVTFEDESGFSERSNTVKSCRSVVDWERVSQHSLRRDTGQEDFPDRNGYVDDGSPMDSYRSSSTAGTEFTCNESNYGDDYITCNEAQTERGIHIGIPPFTGCPCMHNEYMKLVGMCKPRPYGGLNSWNLPD